MAQVLSTASAFSSGHDLWVVSDRTHSRWALKLDWYLNFQMLQGERRDPRRLAEPVKALLEESGLPPADSETGESSPMLISADGRLPARWVLFLPMTSDSTNWVSHLAKVWANLQKPSMRVFLPTGLDGLPFTEEWKKHSSLENCALILDQDPHLQ